MTVVDAPRPTAGPGPASLPAAPAAPGAPTASTPATAGGRAEPGMNRLRVYVWQVPVRVTHWVTFTSIVILSITGAYIADPFLIPPGGNIMTSIRFIHLIAAFVFLASGIVRTYWLFAGNQFARWSAFIPTNRRHLNEIGAQTGWYAFLRRDLPGVLGHNALAGGTYFVVFFLFLVQTVTGFALAGAHGTEPWQGLFGWVAGVFGLQTVRMVHHLLMWAIIAFAIHHVYSALLVDHWERTGIMSSIFSGYKFVTRKQIEDARDGGIRIEEIAE